METKVINGVEYRVNTTAQGEILSGNFRSLKEECNSLGTTEARVNLQRHAFFLGGQSYYVGKSLQGKSAAEIGQLAKNIQICDSSTDGGKSFVPCLFLASTGEAVSLQF